MKAGIALGSNVGDRLLNLREALERVRALPAVSQPVLVSAVYETLPVNCEPGAANFFNAVIEVDASGEAFELMRELKEIEVALGRPGRRPKNISRTIDLDLLYFGKETIETPDLRLPHPHLHLRRFVLQPLSDIAPDLVLPGQTETISALLAKLPPTESRVVYGAGEW